MIQLKAQPGKEYRVATGNIYTADERGIVEGVRAVDVRDILDQGAQADILPATLDLKAQPGHDLYFNGGMHTPDAQGIIRSVPFDVAVEQIKTGMCVEVAGEPLAAMVIEGAAEADAQHAPSETQHSGAEDQRAGGATDVEPEAEAIRAEIEVEGQA